MEPGAFGDAAAVCFYSDVVFISGPCIDLAVLLPRGDVPVWRVRRRAGTREDA